MNATAAAEEQGLLADVCAHPGQDAPRLIYADWCEERTRCPKIQILTIEGLLVEGKGVTLPPNAGTTAFKKAPRAKGKKATQGSLFGQPSDRPRNP